MLAGAACAERAPGDPGRGDSQPRVATDPRGAIPTIAPDIRGTLTWLQAGDSVVRVGGAGNPNAPVACPPSCAPSGTSMRALLIEEVAGGLSTGGAKSRLTVPSTARVLRRAEAGVTDVGFGALRVGQRVEAWFTGPVAESYPTQTTASVIVVTAP